MNKKQAKKKYVTTRDIVIPAGSVLGTEPPKSTYYGYDQVYLLRAETKDIVSEWHMSLEEALEIGLVEEVSDKQS